MVNQPIQFICNESAATDIAKVNSGNTAVEVKNIGTLTKENYVADPTVVAYSAAVSDSGKLKYTGNDTSVWKSGKSYTLVVKFGPVDNTKSEFARTNSIDGWKKAVIPFTTKTTHAALANTVSALNEAINKCGYVDTLVASAHSTTDVKIDLIAKCDGELEVMNMFELSLIAEGGDVAEFTMFETPTVVIAGDISHEAKPAFGSYLSLLKSVRFPSETHCAYGNPWSDGMPVRGREYSQVIIPFKSDRGPIGDSKFAENVTTVRTFVIWAEKTVATALLTELKKVLKAA